MDPAGTAALACQRQLYGFLLEKIIFFFRVCDFFPQMKMKLFMCDFALVKCTQAIIFPLQPEPGQKIKNKKKERREERQEEN